MRRISSDCPFTRYGMIKGVFGMRGRFPRYSCANERNRRGLPSTMRCSYHQWPRGWVFLGEHPFAHFLMRDGFAPIERGDGVLDAGDLRLINIEIYSLMASAARNELLGPAILASFSRRCLVATLTLSHPGATIRLALPFKLKDVRVCVRWTSCISWRRGA